MELRIDHPEDLQALPDFILRQVLAALKAIRESPEEPEGFRHRMLVRQEKMYGDLSGLHSVVIDSAYYHDAVAIVYRIEGFQAGDDLVLHPSVVKVIAVGPRTGSAVFKLARDRIYGPRHQPRGMRGHGMDYRPRSQR